MEVEEIPVEEWLGTYPQRTQWRYRERLQSFLQWLGKTDSELVAEYKQAEDKEEWSKKMGEKAIQFYQYLLSKGYSINTARADISGIRAFCRSQCRPLKIRRGAIAKPQVPTDEHQFLQNELQRMFQYADPLGKAYLSISVSLGWGMEDLRLLETEFVRKLLERARQENLDFIQFLWNRAKTKEVMISHLMPETLESLEHYLKIKETSEKLFPLTADALNDKLRKLCQNAGIIETGKVHHHLLRKFTFTNLQSSMSEIEARLCVGKSVPPDIATYMVNRKEVLLEKFQMAYPKLSLVNHNKRRLSNAEAELEELKQAFRILGKYLIREARFRDMIGKEDFETLQRFLKGEQEEEEVNPSRR